MPASARIVERVTVASTSACRKILRSSLLVVFLVAPDPVFRAWGHLTGRALDWFDVLGYRVVDDKVTDYAHLKQALTEQFPVVRNRSELETRSYASYQNHNQRSSDFVYELLKIKQTVKTRHSGGKTAGSCYQ
ncbi:uncharacterized protein TNCV_371141 [Trichonephila clavipes]|nr:uncharacterized protein TNCV_371141 [Trichonephila clavipes]